MEVVDPVKSVKGPSHVEKRAVRLDPVNVCCKSCETICAFDTDSCYDQWQKKWNQSIYAKMDLIGTISALVWSLQVYQAFLRWNETRTDIHSFALLHDPVLLQLTAYDFSLPLFFLVYGSVILAVLFYGRQKPDFVLEFLQAKTCVVWIRMLALFLVPLEAPVDTIPLIDPIAGGDGVILMRDLFFSGHTATTFLVFLVCRRQDMRWKLLFFVMAAATAIMVTLQKTHYAIDVFAAPFFVYTCHGIVYEMRSYLNIAHEAN